MKRIILIIAGLFAVLVGNSQSAQTNSSNGAVSNSGIVEPTINGKPYSQYKAEQEALKKEREAIQKQRQSTPVNPDKIVTADASSQKVVQNKTAVIPAAVTTASDAGVAPEQSKVSQPLVTNSNKINNTTTSTQQVPDQFKLPVNQPTWDGKPVADKTVQTNTQTERPKLPEIKLVQEAPAVKTVNNQTSPAEKTQQSSTDTSVPAKKQN